MGLPAEDSHATSAAISTIAAGLNRDETTLVIGELRRQGINAQIVAEPQNRTHGPFEIVVFEHDAYDAYAVIQNIEVIEEPDDWFSERPAWQSALFVVVGVIGVLIPLFFALVAIFSG